MKMPVGETLEGAFRFAFGSFLSVLGTVWLPYVAAGAIIGGAVYLLHPDLHMTIVPNNDPKAALAALQHISGVVWIAWLVVLVTTAMVRVGLMRKALGLHEGPVFFYFSLGAPVWRLLGAYLLLIIIMALIVPAAIAGCAAAIAASGASLQQPVRGIVDVVVFVIAVIAPIYAALRFSYFLSAVVVAEGRIGLGRSWSLGGGNVLRMIVIWLAIVIAVSIVFGVLSSFFMPHLQITKMPATSAELVQLEINTMLAAGPIVLVLWVLQALFIEALGTGAVAAGYRAVTGTAEGTSS